MRLPLRRLSRSPLAYWVAVVLLACLTASTVARLVGRAGVEAARYGRLRPVVMASHEVDVGVVLRPSDVSVRSVPAAFLPDGSVSSTAAVVGRTVVVPLFRGAAVVAANLAPDGLQGLAALLPADTRAVAVPTGNASVPLRRGDRVDVLVTFDPPPAGQEPTFPVAEAALVVDVGPEAASLAVGPEEAKRVAFALASGTVTLTVTAGVKPAPPAPPPQPGPSTTTRTGATSGSAPGSPTTLPPNR
ncbi:MAG TPA: Flp pilus assembly protein CpaB [Acidimicrobiales bacterium]|nr:Flp pilus assembly protein CpaB [Acidimicrobiales bacterium]